MSYEITDEQIAEIEMLYSECGAAGRVAMIPCSTVESLISRLRAAERDATRYRWLRECDYEKDGGSFGVWTCDHDPLKLYQGDELDAVIDTAMKGE